MLHFAAFQTLGFLLLFTKALTKLSLGCPQTCTCDQLLVNCSEKHLNNFPLDIPVDTRQLVLAKNIISYLPSVELNFLIDLVYLDLSSNSIHDIEATFINVVRLVYLDLSYNNLSQIDSTTFYLLTSLVVLKLSGNPNLAQIEKNAFTNNTGLRELYLSRTGLTFLDISTVSELPNLRTLDLSFNSWHCYCSMKDFFSWINESNLYFLDAANTTCSVPIEVHGKPLSDMQEEVRQMCISNLYKKDYIFLSLVGFGIFFSGTVAAWIAGVCIVMYNKLCKSEEDDQEDEEEDELATRGKKEGSEVSVHFSARV
ncbi:leucine-rich repeat-containing protein 52 [Microcaecilia unicolor]|uniref:Leucine-rich repeat-containing protein 52 n=1 Tax=Microcaecilia unicolor TaxID=1415580 RepID=A0A6P7YIB2_9AMPH|nr:leucine-rich repeat-containing protein 52 [Microcaecilia unicolor]